MSTPRRHSSLLLLIVLLMVVGCTPTPAATPEPAEQPTRVLVTLTATVPGAATQPPVIGTSTPTRTRPPVTATRRPATTPTRRPATATLAAAALNCARTLRGGAEPNIPQVTLAALVRCRPEARRTLRDIQGNGPFQFSRDDITFENRERFLPRANRGTYREYTVITPNESDRGARRFITSGGSNREPADYDTLYYTDDHYDSFWIVVE